MTPEEATKSLLDAVNKGNSDAVRKALDAGGDVNARNKYQNTLLHLAAGHGPTEIVRLLLARGADPNLRNDKGEAPLHWAAGNGRLAAVTLLIDYGAHLTPKDDGSHTPLELATKYEQTRIARILADAAKEQQGIRRTGKRQWVATLPPEDDCERSR